MQATQDSAYQGEEKHISTQIVQAIPQTNCKIDCIGESRRDQVNPDDKSDLARHSDTVDIERINGDIQNAEK